MSPHVTPECRGGYSLIDGACFKVEKTRTLNFKDAEANCQTEGTRTFKGLGLGCVGLRLRQLPTIRDTQVMEVQPTAPRHVSIALPARRATKHTMPPTTPRKGTHLATIGSRAQQDGVFKLIGATRAWIGLWSGSYSKCSKDKEQWVCLALTRNPNL